MRLYLNQRVLVHAVAAIVIFVVMFGQPAIARAASNPLYIKSILTEAVTTVSQVPKVVQTYGNTGSNTIADVEAFCDYYQLTSPWAIDLNFKVIERPQKMIPGQNTNRETSVRAVSPGQVEVICQVSGKDTVSNEKFTAFSQPLTLTVNP